MSSGVMGTNNRAVYLIVLTLCIGTFAVASPHVVSPYFTVNYTVTFSEEDISLSTLDGYTTVHLRDGALLNDLGKPMLPLRNIRIALSDDMCVSSVHILDMQEQPLDGTYLIYPAQPPQPVGTSIDEHSFVQPDVLTYASYEAYPPSFITFTGQRDLAGQVMADVTLYPLHYVPAEERLTLVTSITFCLSGTSGYVCGDYLPAYMSGDEQGMYQQMVEHMVVNPESVGLRLSPNPQPLVLEAGDFEYVIITPGSWVSAFQPLADWKTQKGVPATIVTTDWIYNDGGYSGTNVQKIRAFVQDAYTTWGTTYVLLGGDIDVVPCKNTTFPVVDDGPVPNDAYYGDFDGDYVCELHVGRASVTGPGNSTGQIGNFINKILTYETNPPLTNYAKRVGLCGFDLDSITEAEYLKIDIDTLYIPSGWSVSTVYDSQSGDHRSNVLTLFNSGQHIINYAEHTASSNMGTGWINHGWYIVNANIDALTNGEKQTIFYNMGCDTTAYDVSNCIAEHFVRNSHGGGVAFIGNSRYGWYNPGVYDTNSMAYDSHFFQSLFQENLWHLGAAFSDSKNDGYQMYPGDDFYKYIFTELTLLGDPELPVWTKNPMSLTVSHPGEVPVGASSFTVAVSSSGASVSQACVCLWKGDEVYERGYTDATGAVTFSVSPVTGGLMTVTVTKHNYLPYVSTTEVIAANGAPNKPMKPSGPTARVTGQVGKYFTSTTDPDGDNVQYRFDWNASGSHQYSAWTSLVASGQTVNKTHTWSASGTYVVKAQARDEHGAVSTWSNGLTVTVTVNHPPNQPKKPSGPTTRLKGQQGTYWANGTDPDGDKIQYRFDWNAAGSHAYSGWTTLVNSGTKLSKVHTWWAPGTYVVKVQSRDEYGDKSVWSNGLTVIVSP